MRCNENPLWEAHRDVCGYQLGEYAHCIIAKFSSQAYVEIRKPCSQLTISESAVPRDRVAILVNAARVPRGQTPLYSTRITDHQHHGKPFCTFPFLR